MNFDTNRRRRVLGMESNALEQELKQFVLACNFSVEKTNEIWVENTKIFEQENL